jgi:hypothetical protein
MLTALISQMTSPKNQIQEHPASSGSINRLLCAAVVNQNFRDLLLKDPQQALAQGYGGETFPLNAEELDLVFSIQADTLRDFALGMVSFLEGNQPNLREDWAPARQNVLVLEAE